MTGGKRPFKMSATLQMSAVLASDEAKEAATPFPKSWIFRP
jgi:hypothetical protein